MKVTLFCQKRATKEGKTFYNYLGRIAKKSGEEMSVQVKFKEEAGQPKPDKCPCIIQVVKNTANLSRKKYGEAEDGTPLYSYKLWVSEWTMTDEKYVDHSLDDFE